MFLVVAGCLRGETPPQQPAEPFGLAQGGLQTLLLLRYGFAPPREAVARVPPRPMVSTAVDGTMTIAPFSLTAS